MVDLWESLTDERIYVEDFAAVCRWNSSFKDILQSLSKQCDEMEEALNELNDDAYQDWLLSFPAESPAEAPKGVAV